MGAILTLGHYQTLLNQSLIPAKMMLPYLFVGTWHSQGNLAADHYYVVGCVHLATAAYATPQQRPLKGRSHRLLANIASISSKLLPLVSGTKNMMKASETTQSTP